MTVLPPPAPMPHAHLKAKSAVDALIAALEADGH
jgi:hypothetical protein